MLVKTSVNGSGNIYLLKLKRILVEVEYESLRSAVTTVIQAVWFILGAGLVMKTTPRTVCLKVVLIYYTMEMYVLDRLGHSVQIMMDSNPGNTLVCSPLARHQLMNSKQA